MTQPYGKDFGAMWSVNYANGFPVMAIVDPMCPNQLKRTYLGATIADYDLFCVLFSQYSSSLDSRFVPGSHIARMPSALFKEHCHPHMGNSTERISALVHRLNAAINYPHGTIINHADEGGRPGVKKIDFPFIAFIPGTTYPCYVKNVREFQELRAYLGFEYKLQLNPGWLPELGFGITNRGSWEV